MTEHDPQTIHHILDLFPSELSVNPDMTDLTKYWVDEESPYIHEDTVRGLLVEARKDELDGLRSQSMIWSEVTGSRKKSSRFVFLSTIDDRIAQLQDNQSEQMS